MKYYIQTQDDLINVIIALKEKYSITNREIARNTGINEFNLSGIFKKKIRLRIDRIYKMYTYIVQNYMTEDLELIFVHNNSTKVIASQSESK